MSRGSDARFRSVVALSGGVGGARFLHGLAHALPDGALTAIVNTGDDFRHWGLYVSPDLDTVMYTLADLVQVERGWGLAEETFGALAMVRRYGGDAWFQLGDRDLGTHLVRTDWLARGETLTTITGRLCRALGVEARVLPMCDAPRRTMIETAEHGTLPFQDWFVRLGAPAVRRVTFEGTTTPTRDVLEAIERADVVLFGPSNPYVSIDPILGLDGVRDALRGKTMVAVSPIVGGQAVKGPLATMIPALTGEPASAAAIVRHYRGLLSGIVVERGDDGAIEIPTLATDTIMRDRAASLTLARATLDFAWGLVR